MALVRHLKLDTHGGCIFMGESNGGRMSTLCALKDPAGTVRLWSFCAYLLEYGSEGKPRKGHTPVLVQHTPRASGGTVRLSTTSFSTPVCARTGDFLSLQENEFGGVCWDTVQLSVRLC